MGILSNPVAFTLDAYYQQRTISSSSGSGTTPIFSPVVSSKGRTHKKGNSSVASITFVGESHWRSRTPKLVSLEVASQTPSITKRGFECMYRKSHGRRLTGGSLYFRPASNLVRRTQRDSAPRGFTTGTTCLDSDAVLPPLPVASITSGPRGEYGSAVTFDVCGDSTKKLLKAAPLISLEEAKGREVSRRNRVAERVLEEEIQVEHEVRRLKREVAEIVRKKEQAKREDEGRLARLGKERQEQEALEALEKRKREEGPSLTAAVAAREDGLVVAPTNWIVPLISLDEARHTEKAKRNAVTKSKSPPPLSLPQPSAVASVDSLMVNAGNGSTATLQLVSLEEAAKRDRARRMGEDATEATESRTLMLAHAGTGLSHVPLITLAEAHRQDALRRENGSSQDEDEPKSPNPMSKSRKPSHLSLSRPVNRAIETNDGDRRVLTKDAAAPQEKARWIALMSNTGDWWTRPNATSDRLGLTIARTPMGNPDWV